MKTTFELEINRLSQLIGIENEVLEKLVKNTDYYYRKITFYQKKNKKKRIVYVPDERLRFVQKYIVKNYLKDISINSCAKGFVQKESFISNATLHIGASVILNIDLKDFFYYIGYNRVYYIFFSILNFSEEHSKIFTCLCTKSLPTQQTSIKSPNAKYIPLGAITSPIISNIIMKRLDNRITKLCKKLDILYSRYVDDLTFSTKDESISFNFTNLLQKIIIEEGFRINTKKTRYMSKNSRKEVTGLVIHSNGIDVKKEYIMKIQQDFYYIKKFGINSHCEKIKMSKDSYLTQLYGKILFVKSVNQSLGESLELQINTLLFT